MLIYTIKDGMMRITPSSVLLLCLITVPLR